VGIPSHRIVLRWGIRQLGLGERSNSMSPRLTAGVDFFVRDVPVVILDPLRQPASQGGLQKECCNLCVRNRSQCRCHQRRIVLARRWRSRGRQGVGSRRCAVVGFVASRQYRAI
jgi:hypothetical protein